MTLETKFLPGDDHVDLNNCDREPIHIPGSIQPHGALLVLDGGRVVQASTNLEQIIGLHHNEVLARRLEDLFNREQGEALAAIGLDESTKYATPTILDLPEKRVAVVPHVIDGLKVLEFEPAARRFDAEGYRQLRQATARLHDARSQLDLCQRMAAEVRRLIDFDRVMVYRFDEDWHGEVIAEAKSEGSEGFLGLHFPATDIPVQARHLYTVNWVRHIADVAYRAVPLEPPVNPRTGRPLDMTYAFLRSVSPIHIEYLKNMGVGASFSISLLERGKLWGLIACHHDSARHVPYEVISTCEFLGQVFSMQLATRLGSDLVEQELRVNEALMRCVRRIAAAGPVDGLVDSGEDLLTLAGAAGVVIGSSEGVTLVGDTPGEAVVADLVRWLEGVAEDPIFTTDRLAQIYGRSALLGDNAAGMLAVTIAQAGGLYLLWFRPEVLQAVTWGGKPDKPTAGETLTPRSSFAAWQEIVEGRSLAWQDHHLAAVAELRTTLISTVFRHIEDLDRLNQELERSNTELDAFAHIASHDLKEPLRGIHSFAGMLLEDYQDRLDDEGKQQLHTLVTLSQRMEDLINSLLHFSRVGRVDLSLQETQLDGLVDDIRELLIARLQTSKAQLTADPLPVIFCDRVRVREVLLNLVANAIKYNRSPKPQIHIGLLERTGKPAAVFVRDNGIGIPERHGDDIFRPFTRLHARQAYGGGTGMGLAIVQKIVDRHGGRIWFESAPTGTTFYFTLAPEEAR